MDADPDELREDLSETRKTLDVLITQIIELTEAQRKNAGSNNNSFTLRFGASGLAMGISVACMLVSVAVAIVIMVVLSGVIQKDDQHHVEAETHIDGHLRDEDAYIENLRTRIVAIEVKEKQK